MAYVLGSDDSENEDDEIEEEDENRRAFKDSSLQGFTHQIFGQGTEYSNNQNLLWKKSRRSPNLAYESGDELLLQKLRMEFAQIKTNIQREVGNGPAHPLQIFLMCLPENFFKLISEYLSPGIGFPLTLERLVKFLQTEIFLRHYNISKEDYFRGKKQGAYAKSPVESTDYNPVYDAFRNAENKTQEGLIWVEPLKPSTWITKIQQQFSQRWSSMFFVKGISYIVIDDDKIKDWSKKWAKVGIKRLPNRSNKLFPVVHLAASIGYGFILNGVFDECGAGPVDAVNKTLEILFEHNLQGYSNELRNLCVFIDRGYLQLSKEQNDVVTNVVQTLLTHGVTFLGTCKASAIFPFTTSDQIPSKLQSSISKVGQRTAFSAVKRFPDGKVLIANFGRHGNGKARVARIITNRPDLSNNDWVVTVKNGIRSNQVVSRIPHIDSSQFSQSEQPDDPEGQSWNTLHSSTYLFTIEQRTPDWFLARFFRLTSTGIYDVVNVGKHDKFAIDDDEIIDAVSKCQTIVQLHRNILVESVEFSTNSSIIESVQSSNLECSESNKVILKISKRRKLNTTSNININFVTNSAESNDVHLHEFLRKLMPKWFMKPIESNDSMRKGLENEGKIIEKIADYVSILSNGDFSLKNIKTYGLLVNREVNFAAASPDAVASLYHRELGFLGLAVLEFKTSTTSNTIAALDNSADEHGEFINISVLDSKFKTVIPDVHHRVQLLHHVSVMDLNYALLVYATGSQVKRLVLLEVPKQSRVSWINMIKLYEAKYMEPLLKSARTSQTLPDLPRIGVDGFHIYGYAIEHHTADLWYKLGYLHTQDVLKHGTPPPYERIIAMAQAIWNQFMGAVDTVRRVLSGNRAQHNGLGPVARTWMLYIDYALFNAHRAYLLLNPKLDPNRFESYDAYSKKKTKLLTYKMFLFELARQFTSENVLKFAPKAKNINPDGNISNCTVLKPVEKVNETPRVIMLCRGILIKANTSEAFIKFRSNHTFEPEILEKAISCALCCKFCSTDKPHSEKTRSSNRKGRNTKVRCKICQVPLCKHCWKKFHTKYKIPYPICQISNPKAIFHEKLKDEPVEEVQNADDAEIVRAFYSEIDSDDNNNDDGSDFDIDKQKEITAQNDPEKENIFQTEYTPQKKNSIKSNESGRKCHRPTKKNSQAENNQQGHKVRKLTTMISPLHHKN